jgi:hypothetical protein
MQVTGIRNDSDRIDLGDFRKSGYVDIIIENCYLLPNLYILNAVIFDSKGYALYDRANRIDYLNIEGGQDINGLIYLKHSWAVNK